MKKEAGEATTAELVIKVVALFALLYLFLLCICLMGEGLKIVGKEFTSGFIAGTNSAFVGLFMGILTTAIVQSSSTTTSIVVGLVAGGLFTLDLAIPIIMGANIGTSVTNILVSFGHVKARLEFRRAFAAAFVHDIFNVLTVLTLFPLQLKFNLLGKVAVIFTEIFQDLGGLEVISPLKLIIQPLVDILVNIIGNGWGIFIISLLLLFVALRYIVVVLKSLVMQNISKFFDRVIFRTQFFSFLFGIVVTVLVQSSSVTTSLIVPLAGAGLLNMRQIFPYTLGSNIGTTITALLASMVTMNPSAVAVAFAHLAFNISGIIIFWPLQNFPIFLAEKFALIAARNRIIPAAVVLLMFFIIPLLLIKFTS